MTAQSPAPAVAVAGCGYWGKNLVRNFGQLGALAAVCDPDEAGRERAAEIAPGVEISDSFDAALACPAVVIATSAETQANATVICGVTIGRYAFIGAGAVVNRDVPDYALMLGVPAARRGWMSRHGHRLAAAEGAELVCPESGWSYREIEPGLLRCLDWPEDKPLEETSP